MKREWVVYGAYDGDKLLYIGKTGHLQKRAQWHRSRSRWARRCEFRVMRKARSERAALRIEAELIWLHQPPQNTHLKPAKNCPVAMPHAEARGVWHSNPTLVDWAVVAEMPGWTAERARRLFGQRERKLIWRRPSVTEGAYRINPKLYRICKLAGELQ
jgi:predicted GIY-YIG superfamily endonuclease